MSNSGPMQGGTPEDQANRARALADSERRNLEDENQSLRDRIEKLKLELMGEQVVTKAARGSVKRLEQKVADVEHQVVVERGWREKLQGLHSEVKKRETEYRKALECAAKELDAMKEIMQPNEGPSTVAGYCREALAADEKGSRAPAIPDVESPASLYKAALVQVLDGCFCNGVNGELPDCARCVEVRKALEGLPPIPDAETGVSVSQALLAVARDAAEYSIPLQEALVAYAGALKEGTVLPDAEGREAQLLAAAQMAYEYLSGVALCDSNPRERMMYEGLEEAVGAYDKSTKEHAAIPDAALRDARIRRATEEVLEQTLLDEASPSLRIRLLELRAAVGIMKVDPHDVGHGLYEITWKEGGTSLAAVGSDRKGDRWFTATNWTSGRSYDWDKVAAIELIKGPPELADLVDSVECEPGDFPSPKEC